MGEGVESRLTRRVESGGALRLPKLDTSRIDATALTAAELESAIARLYEQQTTLAVKLVVVSRLDAGEDHALDAWREPPASERYGCFVVRGLVAPWPSVLSEPLGAALELSDVPFEDVLQAVQERSKLPMAVDWVNLEFAGVDRDTGIRLSVPPDVGVGRALEMILEAASPFESLHYDWVEGILRISTRESGTHKQTMVVNVSPLLEERDDRDEQIEVVVDAIQESVSPDIWRDNGGDLGTINVVENRLVITAPPWALRDVLALLSKLSM